MYKILKENRGLGSLCILKFSDAYLRNYVDK